MAQLNKVEMTLQEKSNQKWKQGQIVTSQLWEQHKQSGLQVKVFRNIFKLKEAGSTKLKNALQENNNTETTIMTVTKLKQASRTR